MLFANSIWYCCQTSVDEKHNIAWGFCEYLSNKFRIYDGVCLVLCRCLVEDPIEWIPRTSTLVFVCLLQHRCNPSRPRKNNHLGSSIQDVFANGFRKLVVVDNRELACDVQEVELSKSPINR